MNKDEEVYIKLQKHLNNQPVGFPATRSGVEIKILKHIFTPQEAEIATCLSYKPESLETVFGKSAHLVESPEELEELLDCIVKNGGIGSKLKDNKKHYCNVPLVVGMYEMQHGRLTPEFIKDFNEYITDRKFKIEFLSTSLPQIRTIPIGTSIQPQHTISTFDEVTTMFHEFGHALHGMFSNVKYPSFSGTSVPRDFVEYPSQVNEMWSIWPDILKNYAVHYETGEAMPQVLLDKVLATQKLETLLRLHCLIKKYLTAVENTQFTNQLLSSGRPDC